jgi:hypothetical protein
MGGNNTKPVADTEWDKHRTSEQSSGIPYEAQIHNKYENNIQELIDNLHTTEKSDHTFENFAKLLNNTSLYNTKYLNEINETTTDVPGTPTPSVPPLPDESPFLLPVKYANLLNSATSDKAQRGGAKLQKKSKKSKEPKEPKKSKEFKKSKKSNKLNKYVSSTSSTDSKQDESDKAQQSDKTTDENLKSKPEEDSNSEPEEESNSESEEDSNSEPEEESNSESEEDSDEEADSKPVNNTYQSESSASNSVHTSQINMLDSY